MPADLDEWTLTTLASVTFPLRASDGKPSNDLSIRRFMNPHTLA